MPTTSNRQASIDSRRIALEREVTIRVPRFDTFVTEYSANISTTGMFIVSEHPLPPGTNFTFEFSVADDWKLIRGKAQVVWTRHRDEAKERPAGMGVRFVELDAQSRRLIRWIVEKHIREGGRPFELDELRNVIDEGLEDVIDTDRAAPAVAAVAAAAAATPAAPTKPTRSRPAARRPRATQARSEKRKVFPLAATTAVVVIGLIFLFWLSEWIPGLDTEASEGATTAAEVSAVATPDNEARAEDGVEASPAVAEETAPTEEATSPPPAAPDYEQSAGSPPLGSAYTSVQQALGDWSSAWSDQDVDGYLAAYSRDFQPASVSRSAWAKIRRERLAAPEFIKVSISQLDVVRVQDNLVEATFFQNYRSDRFSDSVQKVVELTWEAGAWKILRESTR